MPLILFLDDERRRIATYIEEMEDNDFSVEYKRDVDDALLFLADNINAVKLLILDLMMPPGKSFTLADTEDGLRTGVSVYERVREMSQSLPVIIFTNVTEETVTRRFGEEEHCWFCKKVDYMPPALVAKIRSVLEGPPTIG
ncbi:MAG TPA: hypothetical protein VIW80_22540 [Pyrinomonadaceae bacterium]|jgi:CheY-like chemotaxis protein